MKLHRFGGLWAGLALLFAGPAAAQQHVPSPVAVQAEPAPATPPGPALWKISDDDTTIYLFGTIHVLPRDSEWLGGTLARAVDSSDELVTEIGEVDTPQMFALVSELGLVPPGQTLRGMMSVEDRAAFEAALDRVQLPHDVFDRAEPWYAANALLLVQLERSGIRGSNGPEAVLASRFSAMHKPRVALETLRFQLELFDKLPPSAQLHYLRQVADGGPTVLGEVGRITDEWLNGEPDALAAEINADADDPTMVERLLIDRNRNWAAWIKNRLDRPGTAFVAVGAGHLAGAGNVRDQLAALGVTASRVQ